MALPTITNNSPAAGSIAWTAFGIQYAGQSFTIPAGNTASKFVWWLYNGGTAPALQSGNSLPALGSDDMILFLNKSGIGALVPTADLLDGSLIVGGSVIAQALAVDAVETQHISANAVTSDEIAANAIIAKHVSAGTLTADKLSVGTVSDNMVVNGSFEDNLSGTLVGWEINAMTNGTITPVTGVASSGAVSMQMAATTTTANLRFRQLPGQYMPCSSASGRKYYVAYRAGASVATTSGTYLRVNWYDANKVFISSSDVRSNGALTTTFTIYDGQATPPATAKYMGIEILLTNINVVTTAYIDEVVVHEVTMAAQIGDGQITAAKITANTITGDRIAAATIAADKLLVSDRTNYWENPDFEGDTVGGIPKGTTLTATTFARILGAGAQGSGKSMELNATSGSGNSVYSTNIFPVEPGDQFYIQYDYKFLNAVGTSNAGVGFRTYGPTKAAITWANIPTTGRPTTWQELANAKSGIYTVPAGTYFLQPYVTFSDNGETTNRFHVDNIVVRRMNGGELIVDGAIYAAKLATDAVTSDKIIANAITATEIATNAVTADKILANSVTANKLESELVLATKIIAGDPAGTHAEMSPEGFKVYADDPIDGIPNEVVRLGVASTDDYFAITRADGSLAATISQDGVVSGSQVNANDELYYKGLELTKYFDDIGGRTMTSAFRTTNAAVNAYSGGPWVPYLRVEAELKNNRHYRVWTSAIRVDTDPNTIGTVALGFRTGGGYAADGNAYLFTMGHSGSTGTSGSKGTVTLQELYAAPGAVGGTHTASFIMLQGVTGGSGQMGIRASDSNPVRLCIEDAGIPIAGGNGVWLDGTTPPPPPVLTYVKQYGCNNSANYDGNGNRYTYNDNVMYQGLSPAGWGNLKSIGLFPDMTADLSGASINYVRVYFNFQHWYYNSGGTARIGVHGHTGIPGTDWGRGPLTATSGGWPKPGARWVDIDPAHWNGFKTGEWRGVFLEGDGGYGTYGYADRPTIEISYNK